MDLTIIIEAYKKFLANTEKLMYVPRLDACIFYMCTYFLYLDILHMA